MTQQAGSPPPFHDHPILGRSWSKCMQGPSSLCPRCAGSVVWSSWCPRTCVSCRPSSTAFARGMARMPMSTARSGVNAASLPGASTSPVNSIPNSSPSPGAPNWPTPSTGPTILASTWSRRSGRLDGLVHHLGLALGGRPGAVFANRLMLPVSNDTLLRVVRRHGCPAFPRPAVIGIDDWAWRRNQRYGTIVCDLERRRPSASQRRHTTKTFS